MYNIAPRRILLLPRLSKRATAPLTVEGSPLLRLGVVSRGVVSSDSEGDW